jgi:GntR family transcriptional regulator/MocR family aminotransferase
MRALFEVNVQPKADGPRRTARSLCRQLIEAIEDGRLTRGARLPATREAQEVFGVSRNTLADVYDKLLNDGYVVMRSRSGTFVADRPPEPPAVRASSETYHLNPYWLKAEVQDGINFWHESAAERLGASAGPAIDLRPSLVDPRLFPLDVFRRAVSKQLRQLERKPPRNRSPQGHQGSYALREAISRHIRVTRAVVCRPEDVLVTSGAQQAFDLLARTLVTPGETVVAMEDPGYPPMRVAFAAAGARIAPVGVDQEGLRVDRLPPDTGVICVCPSHQFPIGVAMSEQRREQLVRFAREHRAVIMEDDYDGEFRHDGSPLMALRMRDSADVVFYVGTFSKCMLPSLRLGFVVAPGWALPTLITAKNCFDWHNPVPMQLGVAEFIAEGHLTQHVRKMRNVYRERRELVLQILDDDLADWLEPVPSSYGMHVTCLARGELNADALADTLARRGILMHSLGRYYIGAGGRSGLIVGYGGAGLSEIERGMRTLRGALSR